MVALVKESAASNAVDKDPLIDVRYNCFVFCFNTKELVENLYIFLLT